eukprot:6172575-Pleurochrysis_carterae.AAC.5
MVQCTLRRARKLVLRSLRHELCRRLPIRFSCPPELSPLRRALFALPLPRPRLAVAHAAFKRARSVARHLIGCHVAAQPLAAVGHAVVDHRDGGARRVALADPFRACPPVHRTVRIVDP